MTTEQIDKLLEILESFCDGLGGLLAVCALCVCVWIIFNSVRDFISYNRNDKALQLVTTYRLGITKILKQRPDEQIKSSVVLELLDDIEKELVSKVDYKFRKRVVYKESKK